MFSAQEALGLLRDGNRRFVLSDPIHSVHRDPYRRIDLISGQEPFAIILGCADSRVPPEVIFDQGLGDLFVVRVAGNIVTPTQLGSIEFAAERCGSRLVVVLGHSLCGLVLATLMQRLEPGLESESPHVEALIERIRPSVDPLLTSDQKHDPDALLRRAIRANVRASAHQLRHGSPVLGRLMQLDGLLVVGAEYSMETGEVDFFEWGSEQLTSIRHSENYGRGLTIVWYGTKKTR